MFRVANVPSVNVESGVEKNSPVLYRRKVRATEIVSSVVTVVRTFGLFPSCLNEVERTEREVEDGRDVRCHRIYHLLLFVYSLFTCGLCLTFAISGLFFLVLGKSNPADYNFTVFDIILLWQASFLSVHCLFIGNRLKTYLKSLDAYSISQRNENLSKAELTATVIAFANQQSTNFRTSYGRTVELDNLHPRADHIYKTSKKWCMLLSIMSCVTVLCVIVQNIWSEMEDKQYTSPLVSVAHYISKTGSSVTWKTFLSTIVSCLSLLYNVLPHALFVGCAIPLMAFIQNFNDRAELSAQNILNTDKVSEVHYKLRYLMRLLDDCFSSIIFTTIAGDFCQVVFGTFLELMDCSVEGMDAKCSRYFARHIMLILRLCLTVGMCVSLQEKIQSLLPTMEEYSSKSLLNTEKLKLLTLIQSLPSCGISASSFFLITRGFALKMAAACLAYGVLIWKLSQH
ncbi:uncharacterized protein [Centruroides vittatus]|uniref:uncharacterized protein n=1 Tax=Centruroides vittatus TaxID=120091 RepID=UPI00350EA2E2